MQELKLDMHESKHGVLFDLYFQSYACESWMASYDD